MLSSSVYLLVEKERFLNYCLLLLFGEDHKDWRNCQSFGSFSH